jgi:SSS family solute:Na+ symporter
LHYGSDMTANLYGAIVAWTVCFVVTIAVSQVTRRKPESELVGLVYGLTPVQAETAQSWIVRPTTMAWGVLVLALLLNIWFW